MDVLRPQEPRKPGSDTRTTCDFCLGVSGTRRWLGRRRRRDDRVTREDVPGPTRSLATVEETLQPLEVLFVSDREGTELIRFSKYVYEVTWGLW